jgi:hypothetical protein
MYAVFTLSRVMMDGDMRDLYSQVFANVFSLLSEVTDRTFQWKHIHGRGFIGITAEIDSEHTSGKS